MRNYIYFRAAIEIEMDNKRFVLQVVFMAVSMSRKMPHKS